MFSSNLNIGANRDRELLHSAETFCYKETEHGPLLIHVYDDKLDDSPEKPTILFFHGGFCDVPAITQFATQALHFMKLGFICLLAETRVSSKHQSSPVDSAEDAKELIIGLKKNAEQFGIDREKIILVGAAGGAFLALQAAMQKINTKDQAPHPVPAAVIALSAIVNTCPGSDYARKFPNSSTAKRHSPSKLIRKKLPPMLFLHGKNDRIAPLAEVISFRRWMRWKRNRCEVVEYEAADHRFFNFNMNQVLHDVAIKDMEIFLRQLGFIPNKDHDI